MKNCICKIYKDDGSQGTGFFCRIPFPDENNLLHVLITNNHILGENDIEYNKVIEISINNEKEDRNIKIENKRRAYTNPDLDITIIEIKPYKDKLNNYNFLEFDDNIYNDKSLLNKIYKKKSIYALSYPKGNKILVSYGLISDLKDNDVYHNCNTEEGSSGCPILSLDSFKVIGIHCGGTHFNLNKAVFIKYAINSFNTKFKKKLIKNTFEKDILNKNKSLNEMTIIYQVGDYDYTQLFSKKFVENNKENCKIIINNKETELCENIDKKKVKIINNTIQIKLIEIKPIIDMSYMFYNSKLIKIPDISEWNSENVIDMSYMFNQCICLLSLPDISNWNTKNVINMRALFEYSISLSSLPDISKWNTSNVRDMSYMFNGCLDLKSLPDISNWNTDKVINMEAMFTRCTSLTILPDISNGILIK